MDNWRVRYACVYIYMYLCCVAEECLFLVSRNVNMCLGAAKSAGQIKEFLLRQFSFVLCDGLTGWGCN